MPLLKNLHFLAYLINRTFNAMGVHAFTVAIGWHVYQMTGDPLDLGLIGLAQFGPALLLFLAAGIAADRYDRRAILILCSGVQVLCVGAIVAILQVETTHILGILAALTVMGAARGFYHPAAQAILPNIVPAVQFSQAVAFSSSANKAAQLLGPALGGLLIAWVGDGVYMAVITMFSASALSGLFMKAARASSGKEPLSLSAALGGFAYVWQNKVVLGAISIDLLAVLFGGVMGLLPIFASDILRVGPAELGVMRSAPAVGSLIIALLLTQISHMRHMGPWLFASLAIFSSSIIVFGLSETYWISVVALAVYGGADMISVYVRQTLVQIATPDETRGRVSAVNSISINASNELGDFRAGGMAAIVGAVPAVVVGGVVSLGITGLWCLIFPAMRKVDRLDDIKAATGAHPKAG